jgi:hypothetical protein
MELALNEVKLQAKKLLKQVKNDIVLPKKIQRYLVKQVPESSTELKLKHCLNVVSQHFGFINWHHCQNLLSGNSDFNDLQNVGTMFYNDNCGVYINQWFSTYDEAKNVLSKQVKTHYLLPYKTQFVIVTKEYLTSLGVDEQHMYLLQKIAHDLYHSYNSNEWDILTCQVLKQNAMSIKMSNRHL